MAVGLLTRNSTLVQRAPQPRVARPSRFDIGLAVALTALIQIEYHTDYSDASQITWRHIAVGMLLSVPLLWRRMFPVPVGLGVVAVFCFQPELVKPTPNTFGAAICLSVAVGALALYPRSWVTAFVCAPIAAALGVLGAWLDPDPKGIEGWSMLLMILGIWIVAALLRQQTERARRSEGAIVRERLAAESQAQALIAAERSRIARELHDVVSHGMGVLVLQARGGRRVLATDVESARIAFDEIERVSSDCLQEMRLMLDVLRIEEEANPSSPPQRGLGRLDELLGDLRAAGLRVDAEIVGEPVVLPKALDLSAYRIVQEALTNIVQHAPGCPAALNINYCQHDLVVEVLDVGPVVDEPVPGHGLVGMRERVELFDGTLSWGPLATGGFRVRASLPYASTP